MAAVFGQESTDVILINKKDNPSRNMVQAVGHTLMMREVLPAEASRIYLCWRPCSGTE